MLRRRFLMYAMRVYIFIVATAKIWMVRKAKPKTAPSSRLYKNALIYTATQFLAAPHWSKRIKAHKYVEKFLLELRLAPHSASVIPPTFIKMFFPHHGIIGAYDSAIIASDGNILKFAKEADLEWADASIIRSSRNKTLYAAKSAPLQWAYRVELKPIPNSKGLFLYVSKYGCPGHADSAEIALDSKISDASASKAIKSWANLANVSEYILDDALVSGSVADAESARLEEKTVVDTTATAMHTETGIASAQDNRTETAKSYAKPAWWIGSYMDGDELVIVQVCDINDITLIDGELVVV